MFVMSFNLVSKAGTAAAHLVASPALCTLAPTHALGSSFDAKAKGPKGHWQAKPPKKAHASADRRGFEVHTTKRGWASLAPALQAWEGAWLGLAVRL